MNKIRETMAAYSFITVNYNDWQATLRLAESVNCLHRDRGDLIELVVIDNQSELADYGQLAEKAAAYPWIKLIRNETNIGYFPALNVGLRATARPDRVAIVGNNDLRFKEDFLSELGKISWDADILAIAPNIILRNGLHQNPHCISRVPRWKIIGYDIYYSNYHVGLLLLSLFRVFKGFLRKQDNAHAGQPHIIRMGIGACYVLTENFFKHYDSLDERIFLWGEEALLAAQIESAGGRTLYHPGPVVYHDEDDSVSKKIMTRDYYRITQESYRIYRRYL